MQIALLMRVLDLQVDVYSEARLQACVTVDQARRLLQHPAEAVSSDQVPLLQLSCHMCGEAVVDVQSWRRRYRTKHPDSYKIFEALSSQHLGTIDLGRPCPFCQTEYQKTPKVHVAKCLPLLQVVAISLTGPNDQRRGANRSSLGKSDGPQHGPNTLRGGAEEAKKSRAAESKTAAKAQQKREGHPGPGRGDGGGRTPTRSSQQEPAKIACSDDPSPRVLLADVGGGQNLLSLLSHQGQHSSPATSQDLTGLEGEARTRPKRRPHSWWGYAFGKNASSQANWRRQSRRPADAELLLWLGGQQALGPRPPRGSRNTILRETQQLSQRGQPNAQPRGARTFQMSIQG